MTMTEARLTDEERDAINTALVALEDAAMILEGQPLAEVGLDPDHAGAAPYAERQRRVLLAPRSTFTCS